MTLDFENFSVEIDAEATRRAYEGVHRVDEGCDCAGCRNFTLAIGDGLGEGGRRFLASVGIDDPVKAIESCVDLPHGDGTFLYGAWYHLFGRIERRAETVPDVTAAVWGRDRERWIGDNAHIFFADGEGVLLMEDAFRGSADVIQMELLADVPWVLDGPNPYLDE